MRFARENNNDVIIIDTAGRLHIDEPLMKELSNIKQIAHPHEILLVVDALTGQDIVNVASYGFLACFLLIKLAILPAVVVLPDPCKPTIIITVGFLS